MQKLPVEKPNVLCQLVMLQTWFFLATCTVLPLLFAEKKA